MEYGVSCSEEEQAGGVGGVKVITRNPSFSLLPIP